MTEGLSLRNVTIAKDGACLLDINAHIPAGETLTLMGPSGSGKSTLLAFITGTLPAAFTATGQVILNGRDITNTPAYQRRIGILFQDDLLFPHLSVGENLAFGLPPGGPYSHRKQQVEQALTDVGLEGRFNQDPATLSGGQKTRASLMRMLLANPKALLLDEPFSRLDAALRHQIRTMVLNRVAQQNLPALMVTHDQSDADATQGPVIHL